VCIVALRGLSFDFSDKALAEMTDDELMALLPVVSKHVAFNYNDWVNEIERRHAKGDPARTFWLSLVAVIVAGLSLFASVLLALIK
jgi:hypothetical protein